jgi:hypothetical protein
MPPTWPISTSMSRPSPCALPSPPPARSRLRYPNCAGAAGSQTRDDLDDLHARAQPRQSGRAQSVRLPTVAATRIACPRVHPWILA